MPGEGGGCGQGVRGSWVNCGVGGRGGGGSERGSRGASEASMEPFSRRMGWELSVPSTNFEASKSSAFYASVYWVTACASTTA